MEGLPLHQNSLGWLVESGISGLFHAFFRSMSPASSRKCLVHFQQAMRKSRMSVFKILWELTCPFRKFTFELINFPMVGYCILPISNFLPKSSPKNLPLSSAGKSLLFIRFGGFGRCGSSQLWFPSSTTAAGEHGNPNPTEPSWFSALGLVNPKNGGRGFFCDDTILSGFSPLYSY